ncbi:MAG TPA: nucleotidyltransferase family protein [Anaerolineales bacterium]|nr:nucleotidyltransferase family protein [Anaerolineales bacterium]
MDAIVTAGGIPLPEEPLYPATQGGAKALVDIAGKPMIQWILDALSASKTIDNVVIVGLTEKSGLECSKKMYFVSNQGKMVANLQAGARKVKEINPQAEYVLMVSSDIPGITGEMADWVVNTDMQTNLDVYYHIIERQVMEKRYPGCKRTWTRLKGLEVCGGDMNMARLSLLLSEETDLWEKITETRKSPVKQAFLVGLDTAFLLLTGQLTLEKAETNIMSRLNLTGKAVLTPYAEIGMDVDKLFQLEIMREDMKKRARRAGRAAKSTEKSEEKASSKKSS